MALISGSSDSTNDIKYSKEFNDALESFDPQQKVRVLAVLNMWISETRSEKRRKDLLSFDGFGVALTIIGPEGGLAGVKILGKVENHPFMDFILGRNSITHRRYLNVIACEEF